MLFRSGNIRQAIRERYSTPRLRDPMQLLRASIVLTDLLFDIHEARGPFCMTEPRAKGQRLASPHESIRISMNTRIVPSSSYVKGKLAVKPCAYRPSSHYVLSRPRASFILRSCLPHADLVCALSVPFYLIPPTPSSSSCISRHVHQSSASGAWPARTKPGKVGPPPTWLASDITPINPQPRWRDYACRYPPKR